MSIMEQGSDNCIHVFVHITVLGFGNELIGMALFLDYSFFRVLLTNQTSTFCKEAWHKRNLKF